MQKPKNKTLSYDIDFASLHVALTLEDLLMSNVLPSDIKIKIQDLINYIEYVTYKPIPNGYAIVNNKLTLTHELELEY